MKKRNNATFVATLVASLLYSLPGILSAKVGDTRKWLTTKDVEFDAKLVSIDKDSIILHYDNKNHTISLGDLSLQDKGYIKSCRVEKAKGKIADFPVTPKPKEVRWLQKHHLKSLVWEGKPNDYADSIKIPFQLHVPPMDKRKEQGKLPLILHLHGTGGIGNDNLKQVFSDGNQVSHCFVQKGYQENNPCYIMLPQINRMSGWLALAYDEPSRELEAVMHAIRLLIESTEHQIDTDRIYVTGLSMGGCGAFQAMAKFPKFFAAAAPTSFVGSFGIFHKENCGPMWVAVSKKHTSAHARLKEFEKHYKGLGGDIRTNILDTGFYDSWSVTYRSKEFKKWLFAQKK